MHRVAFTPSSVTAFVNADHKMLIETLAKMKAVSVMMKLNRHTRKNSEHTQFNLSIISFCS